MMVKYFESKIAARHKFNSNNFNLIQDKSLTNALNHKLFAINKYHFVKVPS